jgi:putative two-component system response regulator
MIANRGRILAVDDDPVALESIFEALGSLGYDVRLANDGREAIASASHERPDVVLLDVVMPGMDGYEACRAIKSDPETRLIPVVFLTGEGTRDARIKGLEAGATDFLPKGCDLTELDVRVRNLVQFHRLTKELDSAEEILYSLARIVEARDEGTGDHCDRVAALARKLGEHVGLPDDDVKALFRAGYLHDIGKVGVPDAVLCKAGALDDSEWIIMRSHVEIGARLCSPLQSLRDVVPIVRHHHERCDGSGYPDGLRGESIPYLARVFQIVDVFDALTSDRHYRRAFSVEKAIAIIRDEMQRGWRDADVVESLIPLVQERADDR